MTFVVIEGPNGVGKTTVSAAVADTLRARGHEVLLTTEPTGSELGILLRHAGESITGRALALGIAADRALHLESEILPALMAGYIVISDRYVQSSLVLQRIDGLSFEEIWGYNAFVDKPALSVYLRDTPAVISARVAARKSRSRMEVIGSSEAELAFYKDAFNFLELEGWRQTEIDCHASEPFTVASRIVALIDELD